MSTRRYLFLLLAGLASTVALSACTARDDSLVSIPVLDASKPLQLGLTSGQHTYHFIVASSVPANLIDERVAQHGLEKLTDKQSVLPESGDSPDKQDGPPPAYYRLPAMHAGGWNVPAGSMAATDLAPVSEHLGTGIDGVLGASTFTTLNWLWNRKASTLRGYGFDSLYFQHQLDHMNCTAMELLPGGFPAVQLELGGEPHWFILDTGSRGRLSGDLNTAQAAAMRAGKHVAAETVYSPRANNGESLSHALVQLTSVSLARVSFNGLAFDETDEPSKLGLRFMMKLESAALDFSNHRFCFDAPGAIAPDHLPSQEELDRFAGTPKAG